MFRLVCDFVLIKVFRYKYLLVIWWKKDLLFEEVIYKVFLREVLIFCGIGSLGVFERGVEWIEVFSERGGGEL